MAFCVNCGKELQDNFIFCPECGTEAYGKATTANKTESAFETYSGKMKRCKRCGDEMPEDSFYCLSCGEMFPEQQVEFEAINQKIKMQTGTWRNKWVALVLCTFFGWLGIHRFYEGKVFSGIVFLFTLGLFGMGWIVDIIRIATKPNPYRAK